MRADFGPDRQVCPACQGTRYEQFNGKTIIPEQPCHLCGGRGYIDQPHTGETIAASPQRQPDYREAMRQRLPSMFGDAVACFNCQGQGILPDGETCPICQGTGRLQAADLVAQPPPVSQPHLSHPYPPGRPTSQPVPPPPPSGPAKERSANEAVYTLGLDGLSPQDGNYSEPGLRSLLAAETAQSGTLASHSDEHPAIMRATSSGKNRSRQPVIYLGLSFIILLVFSSLLIFFTWLAPSHGRNTLDATPTTPPPPLAIIGGSEGSFVLKYGQPANQKLDNNTNGMLVETFSGNLNISVYPYNRSVYGLKIATDTATWTQQQAFSQCQPFLPSDARLGQQHPLTSVDGANAATYQLGQSTLLANSLPLDEFTISDRTAPPGSFVIEVFAAPKHTDVDNVCTIKLGDVATQPGDTTSSSSIEPILVPTPTPQTQGGGVPQPIPTKIPFDVPSPTPGPTETPLPKPTKIPTTIPTPTDLPTFAPTATLVPATNTPVPATNTPTPAPIPTATATDTATATATFTATPTDPPIPTGTP